MLIYSDSIFNDWLYFTNPGGISKISMANILNSTPQILSLTSPWSAFNNEINELYQSYIPNSNPVPSNIPVLIASSASGAISMLIDQTTEWITLANPMDLWLEGNTIQDSKIVPTSIIAGNLNYRLLMVLNDGAILIQNIPYNFTIGSLDMSSESTKLSAAYLDSDSGTWPTPIPVGILSFNQLLNLVEQEYSVVLTFVDSAGDKLDFMLLGVTENSDPRRNDIASLTLSMVNILLFQSDQCRCRGIRQITGRDLIARRIRLVHRRRVECCLSR